MGVDGETGSSPCWCCVEGKEGCWSAPLAALPAEMRRDETASLSTASSPRGHAIVTPGHLACVTWQPCGWDPSRRVRVWVAWVFSWPPVAGVGMRCDQFNSHLIFPLQEKFIFLPKSRSPPLSIPSLSGSLHTLALFDPLHIWIPPCMQTHGLFQIQTQRILKSQANIWCVGLGQNSSNLLASLRWATIPHMQVRNWSNIQIPQQTSNQLIIRQLQGLCFHWALQKDISNCLLLPQHPAVLKLLKISK